MRKINIIIFGLLLIITISIADTHIPGGDVSGIWTIDDSPFIIDGVINIPVDSTLTIEPGVQIIFSGEYKFDIWGRLLAEGTVTDTISFTTIDTIITWKGLRFWNINGNEQDSTKLVFCKFEYANHSGSHGGAIYCGNSSSIMIKNCLITKNSANVGGGISCQYSDINIINVIVKENTAGYGGGIDCYNSNPNLTNITIIGNTSYGGGHYNGGGGILCRYNSNPNLNNVTITGNTAHRGGGIYCYESNPILSNVTINGNSAYDNNGYFYGGGGIYCKYSNPTLNNVVITGNNSDCNGGGIYCRNYSNPSLTNVIINGNQANEDGGGIYCRSSDPSLINVSIIDNSANLGGGIYCYNSTPNFDTENRCNIFFNHSPTIGKDLYVSNNSLTVNVIVDTFTVLYPNDYFTYPSNNFTFDILHYMIEQINQDLYVSPYGSNDNSGLSPDEPLLTISYALMKIIADSLNPHTIYLANGVYSPSQTGENFPLYCRSYLSFQGEDESSTILDGEDLNGIFYSHNDSYFSIEDITIQNGHAKSGGGIYCYHSSPNITDVTITGNSSYGYGGGGVYCMEYSCPILDNITISNNHANNSGGGVYCMEYSSPILTNVTINGNTSDDGGGIYCRDNSSPILTNVTISGNSVDDHYAYGGGIYCYNNSCPILTNVNIIGNTASGYRSSAGGIYCGTNSNLVLNNVTISGNTAVELAGGILCGYSNPILNNVIISENSVDDLGGGIYCCSSSINMTDVVVTQNTSDYGAGIYCKVNSNPILSNVTITENSAVCEGGGIYLENSSAIFDSVNRSNIFYNSAELGIELYAEECPTIDVIVDTFTVLYPNDYFAYPSNNFTFDILNYMIEQINQDLYVSPYGSNENSGLNPDEPLQTISYAVIKIIADSLNPHTIHLANGVYSPSQTGEDFPLYCRSYLSFQGEDENSTILDGEDLTRIFSCYDDSCFSIENLTIQNGNAEDGGGIYFESSNSSLLNVKILDNNASRNGGGIYCFHNPSPYLTNVIINGNNADNGGGICIEHNSNPILDSVMINENNAEKGGGIYCADNSNPQFSNVIINGNNADNGGGIYCRSSSSCLNNVTIVENIANANGGGIYCTDNATPVLNNVIIIGNTTSDYYGFGGGISCMNNSSPSLSNVTISENSAVYGGGGLYLCNSIPVFDSTNRCNIFLNTTQSENAHDLYAVECPIIDVILDTFTVLYPTNYFAYPIDVFTFDILNAKIEQVNQDLYVSPAGSNNNSGLTPDEPLLTISFALIKILADSTNPHTIHLANGTYSPSQTGEIFPLYSKNYVTLKGEDECITILDAEGLTNVLHCFSNMKFFIEELTITNGNALMGGGIYCCYHSTLYIKNVKIIGNTANHSGGGMYCEYDTEVYLNNVTVSQNIISDNYGYGGGVSCYKEVKFHFTNGVVQHNTARYGGGISLNCSSSRLANVIVANNSANKGGGIYSYYSDLNLFNVTSYGNTASESGGSIYGGTPNTVLVNCIFWNDTPQEIDTTYSSVFVSYSDIQGGWDGEGNIDADPLFADTTNNDFHLTEGSPCIDAGIPDTTGLNLPSWDLDGNYRVWDGNGDGIAIIDMGCYEFDAPPYVGIDDEPESPILFKLYQNYPNPFNFSTTISFSVYSRDAQNAEIRIYNIKGQIVRQLSIVNSQLNWEQSSIEWDGKDERGKLVSSGIYFYQFKVGDKVIDTKKCLLLR